MKKFSKCHGVTSFKLVGYNWVGIDSDGFIHEPQVILHQIHAFNNGIVVVKHQDGTYNCIDKDGNLLSPNIWFTNILPFIGGFARVSREDGKWNLMGTNGAFLCKDMWFGWVSELPTNGFAIVMNEQDQWNFLNRNGALVSPNVWFSELGYRNNIPIGYIGDDVYFFDENYRIHKMLFNSY